MCGILSVGIQILISISLRVGFVLSLILVFCISLLNAGSPLIYFALPCILYSLFIGKCNLHTTNNKILLAIDISKRI